MSASEFTRGGIIMGGLIVVAFALLFAVTVANAQSDGPAKRQSSSKGVGTRALGQYPQDLKARMNTWYEDCRKGWDSKTHMSKKEYERTCRRMAQERVKYLNDEERGRTRAK
jgi:hypothetical protein